MQRLRLLPPDFSLSPSSGKASSPFLSNDLGRQSLVCSHRVGPDPGLKGTSAPPHIQGTQTLGGRRAARCPFLKPARTLTHITCADAGRELPGGLLEATRSADADTEFPGCWCWEAGPVGDD